MSARLKELEAEVSTQSEELSSLRAKAISQNQVNKSSPTPHERRSIDFQPSTQMASLGEPSGGIVFQLLSLRICEKKF